MSLQKECTRYLDVQIINIIKEVLDSVLLTNIMEHNKSHMYASKVKE